MWPWEIFLGSQTRAFCPLRRWLSCFWALGILPAEPLLLLQATASPPCLGQAQYTQLWASSAHLKHHPSACHLFLTSLDTG